MCLIFFGYKVSKKYPLILAANRDEFYQRPTAPMHFWKDKPFLLAGKDLEQGGTWFGVHRNGKFAALTNFRDPSSMMPNAPSRGEIIVDFLETKTSVERWANNFLKGAEAYNGFNLIFGNKDTIYWLSNLKKSIEKISSGIHGLSNKFLNTPWPKIETGKIAFKKAINEDATPTSLLDILKDQSRPDDKLLPHTGVGLEWERILSPLFIQSDIYGTRSSTVMLVDHGGNIDITERTYSPKDKTDYIDNNFTINS
ncbi:MAG: NRDE family protein [Desulfobacteraceae bacterium]|nr:NRDE family protein [Desulfobacteraceae bacterium]